MWTRGGENVDFNSPGDFLRDLMFGIVLGYFRDAGVCDGQRRMNGIGKGILGRGGIRGFWVASLV